MGVPPRYAVPEGQSPKSPSMLSITSPVSRKRRYMDIVLLNPEEHSPRNHQDDDHLQAELTDRVSFKRSKSQVVTGSSPRSGGKRKRSLARTASEQQSCSPAAKAEKATSPVTTKSARPNMTASQTITLETLRPHFEKPLAQVAQVFGICVTLLKKICRKNGLARWPHRQIIGLRKSIASMEQAIGHFEGVRRESYAQQLEKQRNKLAAILEDPTKVTLLGVDDEATGAVESPRTETAEPESMKHIHHYDAPYSHPPPLSPEQYPQQHSPHLEYARHYGSFAPPPPAPSTYTGVQHQHPLRPYDDYHPHLQAFAHRMPMTYHQPPPPVQYTRMATYHQPQPVPQAVRDPVVSRHSVQLPALRGDNQIVLPSLSAIVSRRW